VAVNEGGTLGGSGVVGSLVFNAGSTYLVNVSSSSASLVTSNSAATLSGNVQITSARNSFRFNSPYQIISSTGLSGTQFNAVTAPVGISPSLSYSNSDVFLSLVSNLGQVGGLNQRAVGTVLDRFFNSNQPNSLGSIFGGNVLSNLTQASGESATGSQQVTFNAMSQFMGALTDPFMGRRNAIDASNFATGFADDSEMNAFLVRKETDGFAMFSKAPPASFTQRWTVWAAGFGGSQSADGNAAQGSNDTRSSIFGTAVGADYLFSTATLAGFALAGGGTSFNVNGLGSGRSDLFQAGAYVRHVNGAAYITGAVAYGWQDVTTNRAMTIAGVDQLRAEFDANAYSGRLEGGYRFVAPVVGGIGISPYAAGQFTTFVLPAYAESVVTGTPSFALAYAAKSVTDTRSELGIRTDKSFPTPNGVLTLRGRFAWAHDFDPGRSIGATFQALPGTSFLVSGAAQPSDAALTSASAEWKWINGWSAASTFEGEFSSITRSYAGKVVAKYNW
jgi:uncharacterized protein with beta-barrel porin domain